MVSYSWESWKWTGQTYRLVLCVLLCSFSKSSISGIRKTSISLGSSSGESLGDKCNESNKGVKNNKLPFIVCELERGKVKERLWGCFILLLLKLWRKTLLCLSLPGLADRSSVIESLETKCDALVPWWGPWRETKLLEGSREKCSEAVTGWKSPQPLREGSNKCLKRKF